MSNPFDVQVGGGKGKAAFYEYTAGVQALANALIEEFDDVLDDMVPALDEGLRRFILEPATEICPIKTGLLRSTGYVNVLRKGFAVTGVIGYDTDYALYVHENPDAYHKPPTRWKWLEETLASNTEKCLDWVEEQVRKKQK